MHPLQSDRNCLIIFRSERAWRRASQWIVVVKCRWWSSKCSCPELLSILYIGAITMMEHEVCSIVMAMKGTYGLPILQTSCSIILTAPMYNTDKSSGQEYLLLHHRHTSSFGKICCNSSSQLCYAFLAKEENCHQTS